MGLRPIVSLAIRPVGWLTAWRFRRRSRGDPAHKAGGPLWTVDLRLAVYAPRGKRMRAAEKLQELAGAFAQYLAPGRSRWRLSRIRAGRLPRHLPLFLRSYLTPAELALVWHPLTASVRTPQLHVNDAREFEPPPPGVLPTPATHTDLAVLGRTAFRERRETFGILLEDRFRHVYLAGQTGVGKTSLLMNLIATDVAAGRSTVVLDPHGDMVQQLLDTVPRHRTNDVIVFDPADRGHVVTYNPLACRTPEQRPLVASAVVSSFKRLFGDSWGPRLEHILRNSVLTLLENPGTTLLSLHRLLVDDSFRKKLVGRVSDEMTRSFWNLEFASWNAHFRAEALSPVLNKVGAFTSQPILRAVLGDPNAKLDLREVIDTGKVLFCDLGKGRLGDDASTLLGSLLVAGLQLAAMSRADVPEHERVPAMIFIDEFQNFVGSGTLPTILAEMRKFKIALHASHQYLEQMDDATRAAVFGNVGTIVAFRVGQDAETLAEHLGGDVTPPDLRNLPNYHAIIRPLIAGVPAKPFTMTTLPPSRPTRPRATIIRHVSRQRYGSAIQPQSNTMQPVSLPAVSQAG